MLNKIKNQKKNKGGLQKYLQSNKIKGKHLSLIDSESDFKDWAIGVWGHRKILFKNVTKIIIEAANENNNDNNSNNDNNETIFAKSNANQFYQTNEVCPETND